MHFQEQRPSPFHSEQAQCDHSKGEWRPSHNPKLGFHLRLSSSRAIFLFHQKKGSCLCITSQFLLPYSRPLRTQQEYWRQYHLTFSSQRYSSDIPCKGARIKERLANQSSYRLLLPWQQWYHRGGKFHKFTWFSLRRSSWCIQGLGTRSCLLWVSTYYIPQHH